jgi:hypothetical protein
MPDVDSTAPITNPTVDPTGRPTTGTKPQPTRGALDFDALGAKAYQALTFGFGASIDRALFGKQAADTTRQLVKDYDHDNPLASFGVDLAAATIQSAAMPGVAAKGVAGAVGRLATSGAGMGALQGAGSLAGTDASAGERVGAAAKGAAVGGVVGGAANYLGTLAKPALEKAGVLDAAKGAFERVQAALKKDGKSMADLQAFLKANPGARAADFSNRVAEAVGKAGGTTNRASETLRSATREDAAGQVGRISSEVQQAAPLAGVQQGAPLDKVKQNMIDDLENLQTKRQSAYTKSKGESNPVSPELQTLLAHPEVESLFRKAVDDFNAGKSAGLGDLANAPKIKVRDGQVSSLPSALLDELQKAVGVASKEEAKANPGGSIRRGTLDTLQRAIKEQQTGTVKEGQALSARIGGEETGTGILGAQEFGHSFAFGLGKADLEAWNKIKNNPELVQYARLGMANGLDQYLHNASRMSDGALTGIADGMRDPKVIEILGKKDANSVRQVFEKEAARQRVNALMAQGGNRQAAFHEENESRMASHAANVVGGLGHIVGTTARLLTGTGMSEKQAMNVIQMAAQPGGLAKLKAAGASQKVIDILFKHRGQIAGAAAESTDIKGQR